MSQLLTSWRDSLAVFRLREFKIFALVTLKALYDSFMVFVRTGAIAVCLLPGFLYAMRHFIGSHYELSPDRMWWIVALLTAMVTVMIEWTQLIIVRPSVSRKDLHYLMQTFLRYSVVIILFVPIIIGKIFLQSKHYDILDSAINPWLAVLVLFILDEPISFSSIIISVYRSLLMMIYNAPFWVVFVLFTDCLIYLNSLFGVLVTDSYFLQITIMARWS